MLTKDFFAYDQIDICWHKSKKLLPGLLALTLSLSSLILVKPSQAQRSIWVGGNSTNWFNGGNWDGGWVPTSFINGVIDTPSRYPPTIQTPGAEAEYLTIGSTGSGYLTISRTGTLNNFFTTLGDLEGSLGIADVAGNSVNWTVTELLAVGYKGTGQLSIKNGATVNSLWGNIGMAADAGSKATVTGLGSTWINTENLFIGAAPIIGPAGAGGTGELEILNGGMVINQIGAIGRTVGARGTVTVSGPGSSWFNSDCLYVGLQGQGSLSVEAGGSVASDTGLIGSDARAQGVVTVTGPGSSWTNNSYLFVGESGNGKLTVSNGGQVTNLMGTIGREAGAEGTALVTGAGATWTNNGFFLVGDAGTGTLAIADGGHLISNSQVRIGEDPTGVGAATVTGPGSRWSHSDQFAVGFWGKGSLLIENGGVVSGASYSSIGTWDNAEGSVTVTGPGTHWNNTGALHVGSRGAGSLTIGSGATVSAGGVVSVADQPGSRGSLLVNGVLMGSGIDINTSGRLSGNGTVRGNTSVAGAIAPGNSIGTLNIAGDYTQRPGSTYEVEVDAAGNSDLIAVSGRAIIEGGEVDVLPLGSYRLDSDYTILTAGGGVTGTFDDASMASTFAFLTPELRYDANRVFLTLAERAPLPSVAWTPNQIATAQGIDSLRRGASVWDAVIVLDAASARAAFDSLSGEIHASTQSALLDDSRFLRNAINDRLRMTFSGTREDAVAAPIRNGSGSPALSSSGGHRYGTWAQPFGSWGNFDSDGNAASLDTSTGGVFLGADSLITESWRLGALAGYSHTSLDVDARASSGSSNSYHLGLYAGSTWGKLGYRAGLGHSWHDIGAKRTVNFPGFSDNLRGDYHARTLQAFNELGYRIHTGTASFEPFANLAYVHLRTDGFTEDGGQAALRGARETTKTTFTTLGLRASTQFTLGSVPATVRGTLGWRHAFGDNKPLSRHTFAGSDPFTIRGVPIARNAVVIKAGLHMNVTDDAVLGVSYDGQLGSGAKQHGVVASFTMRF